MRPIIEPGTHPIETKRYIIPTPSIYAFSGFVTQSIRLNTGGMVYGYPQFGKSWGIKYIMNELKAYYCDDYPVFKINTERDTRPNRRKFFGCLLNGVKHSVTSGDEFMRKKRLLNYLLDHANKIKSKNVIFFIDEAQNWDELQYEWLIEIWNTLEDDGLILLIFLVGQPNLIYKRNSLKLTGSMQIVNRFMTRDLNFCGLKSVHDVENVLKSYDIDTEYPPRSSFSYSRFFCESAFDSGWRLYKEAGKLWNIFKEIREAKKVALLHEIPIKYLARTVEKLLLTSQVGEDGYTYKDCKSAVDASEYVNGCDYIIPPKLPKPAEDEQNSRNKSE